MDNFLEILIPLAFAAIYFLGNMFSKKSEDDSAAPAAPRRGEDPEAAERQRRIQDEIRRKIQERRGGEGGRPRPQPSASAQRPQTGEGGRPRPQPSASAQQSSRPESSRTPAPKGAFSWDESDNAYEHQMQAKLQQIEATQRRAAQLKEQARSTSTNTQSSQRSQRNEREASTTPRKGSFFGGSVRSTLRDPGAARAAFIYSEVIGQPISQRGAETVPGLVR